MYFSLTYGPTLAGTVSMNFGPQALRHLKPLIDAIAADLGASRLFTLRTVTLPILWPGIWSGALFAFLLSWGNFPLSLYTAGADSTIPKWLYSKMVAGYTPMVPALGTMSTLTAASLLLAGGLIRIYVRRRNAARASEE